MRQRLTHTIGLLLILAGSLLALASFRAISADLAQAAPLTDTAVPETTADNVDSQALETLPAATAVTPFCSGQRHAFWPHRNGFLVYEGQRPSCP